jgi:isochorismatase family protein
MAPRPNKAIFDKLAMWAFEGTPLAFALHDRGIGALAVVGIATGIGIGPTARHAADLGTIPVVIEDACGGGHVEAAQRPCEALRLAGDAIMTDAAAFCAALGKTWALPQFFLLFGLWPAAVLPAANGLTGAAPPFLRFLSAFGFFFSLLLRICPLAMTVSLAPG